MTWFSKKTEENKLRAKTRSAEAKSTPVTAADGESKNISSKPQGVKYPFSSEKAVRLQSQGQYTFVVAHNLTKVQLKKDVEKIYGVKVKKVTNVNLPGKVVYSRGRAGRRVARRYMRVQLATGQSIDLTKF